MPGKKKGSTGCESKLQTNSFEKLKNCWGETWVQLRGEKSDQVLQGLRSADGKLRYVAFMIVNYVNLKNSTSIAVAV